MFSVEFLLMSTGRETINDYRIKQKARRLQRQADQETTLRYHAALPLSALLAVTKPTWVTAAANAVMWDTDRTDGKKGKEARRLWPELPRTKASMRDPEADKRLQYGNRAALFARACAKRDWESAVIVGAETVVSVVRDRRMAQHRGLAEAYEVGTDAIGINRVKTAAIALGEVVALSPLAENDTVRRVALGTIAAGTLLGVIGAEQYGAQVREQIRELG